MDFIKRFREFIHTKEILFALLIILAGTLLRIAYIGSFPVGLNQDEASAGYEAWALLNYGIDRNGDSLPVLFVSWGSGQNVLYSYLSMPFIAIFGLNEFSLRLVSGILGSLTLPIFYLLAKKIRGSGFGLLALLVLAFNPWHIMLSRWALESNLLPFFILLGIYFLVLARDRPWFMLLSAVAFALSLYSYGTAFIFLPIFFVFSIIFLVYYKELKLRSFFSSLILFIVISLPIIVCNIINILGLEEIRFFGLTMPALTETRQASTTIFGGGGIDAALDNLGSFFKLLWLQSDGLPWNSTVDYGLLFGVPGLIFALIGLFSSIYCVIKRTRHESECFILFALIVSFLASCLMDVNVNRINMAFLPIIYFQSLGIYFVAHALGEHSFFAFVPIIALLCALFAYNYFTDHQKILSPYFFEGLGDAIDYAESLDTDTVWLTADINAPYIFVLFYVRIPPEEFISNVKYIDPGSAFRAVSSFGKYRFGGDKPKGDCVYIVSSDDDDAEGMIILRQFGNYAVTTLP